MRAKITVLEKEPERLTIAQAVRLVEIAHETTDPEVRVAALRVLIKAENPPMLFIRPPDD